jgi:large subunit ribosomal protein L6
LCEELAVSRVGQAPIPVPAGVEVKIDGQSVTITGPRGELSRVLPDALTVALADGEVTVTRADDERDSRALHGLFRSLLANMVTGVTEGYTRGLEIVGVGYRATAQGDRKLELSVGYSHTVTVDAPEGITFEVPSNTRIEVIGIDKEKVGQVAADIRAIRKPEPYKGKGIRYRGEVVRRKAGKAASAG